MAQFISQMEFQSNTSTPYTTPIKYTRYKRDLEGKILTDSNGNKLTEVVTADIHTQSTDEISFIVDSYELFGIPLKYPGLLKCFIAAFTASKAKTPFKTGYSRNAYKYMQLDESRFKIYYDKSQIVGGMRDGKKVDVYYPAFWFENRKLFNFLDILIKEFYDVLYNKVKLLFKKNDPNSVSLARPSLKNFERFKTEFDKQYEIKRDAAKKEMLEKDTKLKALVDKIRLLKAEWKLRHNDEAMSELLKNGID